MKKLQSNVSRVDLSAQNILSISKIYIPTCLFIGFIWLMTKITDISIYELVADPNEVGNIAPYTGMVSTLGVLFLCCAASICFFSASIIKVVDRDDKKWKIFLLASSSFLLLLLFDDVFQIHENFSTLLFGAEAQIGLVNRRLQNFLEAIVFAIYGSIFIFYVFYFRKLIYRTNILVLILTLLFFGVSLIIDLFYPENMPGHYILEEGFKLLGIVSLLNYYIRICYQQIKNSR